MKLKQIIERSKLFPTIARTSPILYLLMVFLYCMLSPSYHSFYLLIVLISLFPINWIIKHLIFQPIYKVLKSTTLPIIGRGARPPGANSCNVILDAKPSSSYGMPSGHSQITWSITTYILCNLIYDLINISNSKVHLTVLEYIWRIFSIVVIFSIGILVSYSRVYIDKCHTIQQVIVGAIFGIVTGGAVWYYEDDAVNYFRGII